MKIKFIGDLDSFTSSGKVYQKGVNYEVNEKVANYLLSNFSGYFAKVEEPKVEIPEVEPKPASKPKRTSRRSGPTKKQD